MHRPLYTARSLEDVEHLPTTAVRVRLVGCVLDRPLPLSRLSRLTDLTLKHCTVRSPVLQQLAECGELREVTFAECSFHFAGLKLPHDAPQRAWPVITIELGDLEDVQLLIDVFRPRALNLTVRVQRAKAGPPLMFGICDILRLSATGPQDQARLVADALVASAATGTMHLPALRGPGFVTGHLDMLRDTRTLKVLQLEGIEDNGTHVVAGGNDYASLRALHISNVDYDISETLAGLTRCPFTSMNYVRAECMDDGACVLLADFAGLKSLFLTSCRHITAAGIRYIIENSQVNEVCLTWCERVGPADESALNSIRSNCTVTVQ
jgi:hypothetical protein